MIHGKQPKVNVLISTYNGEKYVDEQIQSILDQTYPNIFIYIRDDGSTDNTVEKIKEKYGKFVILDEGKNVGFARSFYKLLKSAIDGDYWAFCDQDDIWMPEKIQRAVEWLEKQNNQIPLLFHGSFELVSEDLKEVLGVSSIPKYEIDFRRALTDCIFQGFSIVINCKMRDMILACDETRCGSHDWMSMLIAIEFGKYFYDEFVATKHRRLTSSQSSLDLASRMKWFVNMFFVKSNTQKTIDEFYHIYGNKMRRQTDKDMLELFISDNRCIRTAVVKAFYPKRWRPSFVSEMAVRILMIVGKI